MKRRGCARCGTFVLSLDQARYNVRYTVGRSISQPTSANQEKAKRAQYVLNEAKRLHDEHMAEHEEEALA